MSEGASALSPGAALPPPPVGSDAVGVVTKKEGGGAYFKGNIIEGTIYPGVVVDLSEETGPDRFNPGQEKTQCKWLIAIEGREAEGAFPYWTSFSMHEKSHLPGFLIALQKPAPPTGIPLSRAAYVGAKCGILLETPEGKAYSKITKVLKRS